MIKRQNAIEKEGQNFTPAEKELLKSLKEFERLLIRSKQKLKDNQILLSNTTEHIQSDNRMLNSDIKQAEKQIERIKTTLKI